jgi:hypothetical protein
VDDLIKALQILRKYDNPEYPTWCDHDVLGVAIDPDLVSDEDKKILEELGFDEDSDGGFTSYKFGSC